MATKASDPSARDRRVMDLYDQLVEIEQRLIPTGLHVFGRPSRPAEQTDMLRMIASFDRPEVGARALPALVAGGLGLKIPQTLLSPDEKQVQERELIQSIISTALNGLQNEGIEAAIEFLQKTANVAEEDSRSVLSLLEKIAKELESNTEIHSLTQGPSRRIHPFWSRG